MKAARKPERRRRFKGIFGAPKDRMLNAPPTKGGVGHDLDKRRGISLFPYLSHSSGFVFYSSDSPVPIQENRGGRERPPPKAGGHVAPIAARCGTPLFGPMGVALVLIVIPAGRPGIVLRRGTETTETDL